jgi:hypothetical protein
LTAFYGGLRPSIEPWQDGNRRIDATQNAAGWHGLPCFQNNPCGWEREFCGSESDQCGYADAFNTSA